MHYILVCMNVKLSSPPPSLSLSLSSHQQAQYLFVYDALLHAFIHGCTEIRASLLGTHLASLDKPASSGRSEVTILEQEFKHVLSMRFPADHFFSVAMEECNAAKNRSIENLPCRWMVWELLLRWYRLTCDLSSMSQNHVLGSDIPLVKFKSQMLRQLISQ